MEEHFSLLLGTALKNARFIPAPTFSGSRPGYYFTNGLEGLGYYLDTGRGQIPHVAENPLKKMKRSENQGSFSNHVFFYFDLPLWSSFRNRCSF